jgi:hypothetical protein
MPTARECRHNAEICLKLARETNEIYARTALLELATEVYRRRQRRALPAPRERRTGAFPVQEGKTVQQQQQIQRGHETKDG